MDQILNKVRNVDPYNSEEVKNVVANFIQSLPKYKELHSNRLLHELLYTITRFPKYCMIHRSKIEIFLLTFLTSSNYNNVIEAAKCSQALQQVRPSQEKTATPKTSWRDQMTLLCNSAHVLLEVLFTDTVDIYRMQTKPQMTNTSSPMSDLLTNITKKSKDYNNKQPLLQARLKNILVFLQAMLIEPYPVAKPVQPQTILDVIVRILSMSSGTNQHNVDIASVKIYALKTLDALIACLGPNLIPYSALVFRIVLQTLRWTSDNQSDAKSKVRCAAYDTLGSWLTTLRVHKMSDNNTWEEELTAHVIEDITPTKKLVELTIGPQPTKHLSKKAKRKLATTQLQESTIAAYGPGEKNKISASDEANNEVVIAALRFAETFLTVCGRFMKPATHKLIQECLVRECFNYPSYSDESVLGLLRVLEAARKSTPSSVPPPTQYCLHLYSLLVSRPSAEISSFCSQALLNIRLHLHCSPPSINFALEASCQTEKTSNKRKKISEKNRAMLESLLGPDRVPVDDEQDVISLLDESSSKKPRLENDEAEKISLSSDSGSSVEISDESDDNVEEVEVVVEINKTNEDSNEVKQTTLTEEKVVVVKIVDNEDEVDTEHIQEENNDLECSKETLSMTNDIITEVKEINKKPDGVTIYEAQTQLPLKATNDTFEDERPLSLEIGYDYPNTAPDKVAVLEKVDDENLPSTNDTDDIQITCGQIVKNSQEVDVDVKTIELESKTIPEVVPKVNEENEKKIQNGITEEVTIKNNIDETSKLSLNNDSTTVEDMLADFVDEVNDEVIAS